MGTRAVSLAVGRFLPSAVASGAVGDEKAGILSRISSCRTWEAGCHLAVCGNCGTPHFEPDSCRNRNCPNCQGVPRESWRRSRSEEVIPVQYLHVVFTVPSALNGLFLSRQKKACSALFASAWGTVDSFGRNAGVRMGMTAVLHLSGSALSFHPHLHCIVPAGGEDTASPGTFKRLPHLKEGDGVFLFPVKAMGKVFRAKFIDSYTAACGDDAEALRALAEVTSREASGAAWNVFAKPACGHGQVVDYLARYAYRTAISNGRIIDVGDESVRFDYHNYASGNPHDVMELSGTEFVRRFAAAMPERGLHRIRHFGFLSPGSRQALRELQAHMGTPPVGEGPRRLSYTDVCRLKGIIPNLCPACRELMRNGAETERHPPPG